MMMELARLAILATALATCLLAISPCYPAAAEATHAAACLTASLVQVAPLKFRSSHQEQQTSVCLFCAQERFTAFASEDGVRRYCSSAFTLGTEADALDAATFVSQAILDYLAVQGHFWEDSNAALQSLAHLVRYM